MFGPSIWVGIAVLSSVRTTARSLLDPVFTMVRAAPTPEVEPLGMPVRISPAAYQSGASAPANRPISRSGGAGQGRRQPASSASEPLTVRRHAGYRAGALMPRLSLNRSPHCLLREPPQTCVHSPPLLSYLVRCRGGSSPADRARAAVVPVPLLPARR